MYLETVTLSIHGNPRKRVNISHALFNSNEESKSLYIRSSYEHN
jgi:hypothetical protein